MTILRYAVEVGQLPQHALPPKLPLVPECRRVPRVWTVEDVGRLLDAAGEERGKIGPVRAADFWRVYVLLLYDTGLGKSVTLQLPPAAVDYQRRLIYVPAERQKTRQEQVVSVSVETLAALERIRRPERRAFLFPWPYDRYPRSTWTAFQRRLRRIVQRAGLSSDRGISQRLRRTRASYGELAVPGSATRDLGHASRAVTERFYLDPTIVGADGSRVVDLLPRPGGGLRRLTVVTA